MFELRYWLTEISIVTALGKEVGTLFTQSGDRAIAYLRFDRALGTMQADTATVEWDGTEV